MERINSAALEVGDVKQPGVRDIIRRLQERGNVLSPQEFVDGCLDLAGDLWVSEPTRSHLVSYAEPQGDLRFDTPDVASCSNQRVADMLQLIVATREFQLA